MNIQHIKICGTQLKQYRVGNLLYEMNTLEKRKSLSFHLKTLGGKKE